MAANRFPNWWTADALGLPRRVERDAHLRTEVEELRRGVDEPVVRGHEARRRERVQDEPDEREPQHEQQRVAPQQVAGRPGPVEPHQRDHGQHEVDRAVVDVPERQEPAVAEERLLDRALVVQAEELLGRHDLLGVAECVGARPRSPGPAASRTRSTRAPRRGPRAPSRDGSGGCEARWLRRRRRASAARLERGTVHASRPRAYAAPHGGLRSGRRCAADARSVAAWGRWPPCTPSTSLPTSWARSWRRPASIPPCSTT